jgi:glucose-6-phosphate 1-dehydrogenase
VVVEKPFGKDAESSAVLSAHLSKLFTEEQVRGETI